MDPLSLTASVAGIVSLAGTVYQGISKYIQDAKDAPKTVRALATEVRSIFGILNNLSLLLTGMDQEKASSAALQHSHLDACRQTLSKIDLQVSRALRDFGSGSRKDALLRRMRWPFSKDQTQELLQQMSRHKESISLALSADSMAQLMQSLSMQKTLEHSFAGMSQAMEDIRAEIKARNEIEIRAVISQQRRVVIDFFQKANPQSRLESSLELRQENTCRWILQDPAYQQWTDSPGSRLWLSGIPGSGKTVLCGAMIQDVLGRSSITTAAAFFFCEFSNPDSQAAINILGSLAVQLALQNAEDDTFAILEAYYDELHPPNGLTKTPHLSRMEDIVQQLSLKYDKVHLVVDALDECGGHNSAIAAQSLKTVSERARNMCIALSSRDEDDIRSIVEDDFHQIEITAQMDDLTLYIGARMGRGRVFPQMLLRQPALYQDIRRTLLEGAQGTFRWVACQLDHLESLPSHSMRRRALKSLPKTLFQIYQRILDGAFEANESEEARDLIRKTLHWIAVSSPPLTIPQLCEAVSVYDDANEIGEEDVVDEYEIQRLCSSLIRKTRDGKRFEFAHFTVREFLESSQLPPHLASFQLCHDSAMRNLAMTCLRFFLLENFAVFDGAGAMTVYPFYAYAVANWLKYAKPYFTNSEVLRLSGLLFGRSKSLQFQNFARSTVSYVLGLDIYPERGADAFRIEAADVTTLHFASALGIPELCAYLADIAGMYIDSDSKSLGFPCNAALSGLWAFGLGKLEPVRLIEDCEPSKTVEFFVERGSICTLVHPTLFDNTLGPTGLYASFRRLRDTATCAKVFLCSDFDLQFSRLFVELLAKNMSTDQFTWKLACEICNLTPDQAAVRWRIQELIGEMRLMMQHFCADGSGTTHGTERTMEIMKGGITSDLLEQCLNRNDENELRSICASNIEACLQMRFPGNRTLLHLAAAGALLASTKVLCSLGFPVEVADENGNTPLHMCCGNEQVHAAKILLQQGADITAQNNSGNTIWHLAASRGSIVMLDFLVHYGADIRTALQQTNNAGDTPTACSLHQAWGHRTALFLISLCERKEGYFQSSTPLWRDILRHDNTDVLFNLIDKMPSLLDESHSLDENGRLPIHYLGFCGNMEQKRAVVQYFDLCHRDAFGKSAVECAIDQFWLHNDDDSAYSFSYYQAGALKLLISPPLIHETGHGNMTLWEYICLSPCAFYDPAKGLLRFKLQEFYSILRDGLKAGLPDAFESQKGLCAALPLLPFLLLLDKHSLYDLKPSPYENVDETSLREVLEHALKKVPDFPVTDSAQANKLPLYYNKIAATLNGQKLPGIEVLSRFLLKMQCPDGKASYLEYLTSLDLPAEVRLEMAGYIDRDDFVGSGIGTFIAVSDMLATCDPAVVSYRTLPEAPKMRPKGLIKSLLEGPPEESPRRKRAAPVLESIFPSTTGAAAFSSYDWQRSVVLPPDLKKDPILQGCNLLHAACLYGMTAMANFYLETQLFDIDVENKFGCTPLFFAARGAHMDTVQFLMARESGRPILSRTLQRLMPEESRDVYCAACSEDLARFDNTSLCIRKGPIKRLPFEPLTVDAEATAADREMASLLPC